MADQPCLFIFIIDRIFKFPHGLSHSLYGFVQNRLMQKTGLHRYYPVGSLGIDPGLHLFSLDIGKGRDCFVPVMPGIFHADNRLRLSEISQQPLYFFLFFPQLLFIRQGKHRTSAAALFLQRTGKLLLFYICFIHIFIPNFLVFPLAFPRFLYTPVLLPDTLLPAGPPDRSNRLPPTVSRQRCPAAWKQ